MSIARGRLIATLVLVSAELGCDPPRRTTTDGGSADAMVRSDAGLPLDAGTTPGRDAGPAVDAGAVVAVPLPTGAANWTFYGAEMGGPNQVLGASYDEGGNLWVAGGEQGLFLLRAGATRFQQLTMADGLRPYGYMPDGTVPPGDKYLNVISVSGAWAGTVFVGYRGKPPPAGAVDCESNWDGPNPDPSIYKSGDADKVTLNSNGNGISVIHYDISSGPGLVRVEMRGREKLCHILRIRYDKANSRVWFGGNHGFAMGDANYQGTGSCQWESSINPPTPTTQTSPFTNEYGHYGCSGVLEHVHPAINGYLQNNTTSCCQYLTEDYYGVSVDPVTKDVWFGGLIRTTKFHYGVTNGDYYTAESETEDPPYISNRIDVWPDQVEEPDYPMPDQRVDDAISGAAAMADGSVWVSSFVWGMAHIDSGGAVTARVTTSDGLAADKLSAIAADPLDQSVWAGSHYGFGISRLAGGAFTTYDHNLLGWPLANQGVVDIQSSGTGSSRVMVVSFSGDSQYAGAVGVYNGP
jgi:hypothetical protein